ncbi:efflux RND transporter periplasmic adaptor subunit [Actibacterium sp. D379-3]
MMRLIALFSVLALLSTCGEEKPEAPLAPRPVVSEIIRANPVEARDFTGVVAAGTEVDLGFQATGHITSQPASVGDLVTENDELANLDPDDLETTRRAAAAGVTAAQARLVSAGNAAARVRELVSRGVASDARLEEANRALTSARAEVERARAALIRAEDARGFASLIAPMDGVITKVYADIGTVVSAGEPVLRLAGIDVREAVIDLPEAAIDALGPDAEFDVRLRTLPSVRALARVDGIDPVADTSTRTRRVHLTLTDPPEGMRLGALVLVQLTGGGQPMVTVDKTAVFTRDGTPHVWRVQRSGDDSATVEPVAIQTESMNNGRLRVLSGLKVGDEVVVKGVNSLEAGQAVGRRAIQ